MATWEVQRIVLYVNTDMGTPRKHVFSMYMKTLGGTLFLSCFKTNCGRQFGKPGTPPVPGGGVS